MSSIFFHLFLNVTVLCHQSENRCKAWKNWPGN